MVAAACGSADDETQTTDTAADASAETPAATATAAPEAEPTEEPKPEPTASPEPEPTEAATEDSDELTDEETAALALAAEDIDWSDCGGLQCGSINVPLDYSGEHDGTLEIALRVRRSTSLDDRVGYLLVNPGGPGIPSLQFVNGMASYPDELLEAFDIVGFDPRGVGESEPEFACGIGTEQFELLQQIDELPDTPEEVAIGEQAAQLCVDSMGPAGRLVHSEYVARDMDEIRKALGAEQISYLGFSYGSTLGGWYASLFPENVRSMAIDGAGNPLAKQDTPEQREQALRDQLAPLYDAFERALASCDSDSCPIYNGGDPAGYFTQAATKMNLLADASNGDWGVILAAINGGLYQEASWPLLHNAIADLQENDDASGFVALGAQSGIYGGLATAVQHINCLDEQVLFPEQDLQESLDIIIEEEEQIEALIEADYPLFYAALKDGPTQMPACVFYDAIQPPPFGGTFDGGDIPILVVGNDKDQITPLVQSEQYANEVLADGRLIITSHFAHVVYPQNACVNDLVHAALIDLEYPDDEPVCPEQTLDDIGSGVDPDAAVDLIKVELPDGAVTLRPADWAEVNEGVYLREDANPLGTLFVIIPTEGDPEGTLELVSENLPGVDLEPGPPQEINGSTWETYEADVDGANLAVRVALGADSAAMVLLQATTEDIDGLTEAVLIPALEAFQPAP